METSKHQDVLTDNAPEGCRHGTHTDGTAYPLGTYARVYTDRHTAQSDKSTMGAIYLWSLAVSDTHASASALCWYTAYQPARPRFAIGERSPAHEHRTPGAARP